MNDDDFGLADLGLLLGAALIAMFIGLVVELIRLPGRFWRAIK